MPEQRQELTEPIESQVERRVNAALAEFAAGAGHELNNPLAIIRGRAQGLLRDETDASRRRDLAQIIDQTRRAYEMIASLRAFARPPRPEPTTFDAREFYWEWTRRERALRQESELKIETREPNYASATLLTDPAMLNTILDALARNGSESTLSSGRLFLFSERIETERAAALRFGVEDDGPGIAPENRELIFAPFFSGRRAGRGLGFGLSKALRFSETLGARLWYEPSQRYDSGCRWLVEFDLRDEFSIPRDGF